MKSGNSQRLTRSFAVGTLLLAGMAFFWPVREPAGKGAAAGGKADSRFETVSELNPDVDRAADSPSGAGASPVMPVQAPVTLAKNSRAAGVPVPPSLDLRRLPLPPRKGDEAPAFIQPSDAVIGSLERLFESHVGAIVEVKFADRLHLSGELLRKELQPGTAVLGVSVANETSTLHLERTRRGSYRGSIVHRDSAVAHRLETLKDGTFSIEQRSFHELICAAPGATPQAANGLPLPAGVINPAPEEGEVAGAVPPARDSRPLATAVIYLDFDGQAVTGTEWNSLRNTTTINAAASTLTTNQMDEVWRGVAEDFSPFNISVTTNLSRYNAAPQNRRIRVIVTPTSSWYGSAGGVAYLGSFRWTGDTPCWVFEDLLSYGVKNVAEAASHEAGHTFDLKHDGRGASDYYYGVDNALLSWAPIMGVGYNSTFSQWSRGEYSSATNVEDDLGIISNTANGFGYRTDDKADSLATAPSLLLQGGSSTLVSDSGTIEKNTDLDLMRFNAGAGTVSLQVRPAPTSPNLYLKAELLDAAGTVLLSRTATKSASNLTLSQSVAAGTYYLRVDGVGMPVAAGSSPPYDYDTSGYGSIGEYTVTGSIPVGSAPAVLSVNPTVITQSAPAGQNAGSQSFTVRNAGGGSMNYTISESIPWLAVTPPSGTSSGSDVPHTLTYSSSGLAAGVYDGIISVTAAGVSGSPATVNVSLTVSPTGSGLSFSNASAIAIPSSGTNSASTPYPSTISVSGVAANLTSVTVAVNGVQHAWANDLDLLLVAPNGQSVMLLSDAGAGQPISGGSANLVFRDDASPAPENAAFSSGVYRPTNYGNDDVLPAPAPPGPHGATLSSLLSGGVNGTWRLFVADDFPGSDGGQISGGWNLTFIEAAGPPAPGGVSASDGTFTDKVLVTWSAASGATSYEIFRSLIDQGTGAQSLGTTAGTTFDDLSTEVGQPYFYWVKAINTGGASPLSSSDAGFRGAATTTNDAFSNRAVLPGTSATITASTLSATKESGEPLHAGNAGGKSVWWSWTAPAAGTLTLDTIGSSFDTLLGVYTGTGVAALTVRGSDDDSGGNLTSRAVVQVTAGTTYAIAVDGYGGAAGSATLNLAFVALPQLPLPPPSLSASDGTLSDRVRVTWAAGTGATSYDVRRHTSAIFASSTLLGNTASLTFDDTTAVAGTTYHYWIVSRNSVGSAENPAGPETGFRTAALSNDNFANRALLSGATASVTANNATGTKEGGEPNHGGNTGGKSLWWRWIAPAAGNLTIDTIGSSFDTVLGVYTGGSLSALTNRGSDDDAGGNLTSRVALAVTAGTEYQIAVDGYGGESGNVKLQLNFQPTALPPSPPGGVSASDDAFGDRVRVTWNAGAGATTYEVYRHTGTTFAAAALIGSVPSAPYDDLTAVAGTTYRYWVVSRNVSGSSSPAGPDSGRRAAATPNNLFAFRAFLSGNTVTATGDTAGAGKEIGEPNHAGDPGGNSLWWTWTAPADGSLTVDTFGSDFDTLLGVYTGTNIAALAPVASNDDFNGSTSRVSFVVTSGTAYHIAVDGFRGASGIAQVHLAFQPGAGLFNDNFADRTLLSGESLTLNASNAEATLEINEPSHGGRTGGRSLWWSWTAPRDGVVVINTLGSSFDTTLGVYVGEDLGSLFEVAGNDDSGGSLTSAVSFEVFAGEVFAIAVDAFEGASGSVVLNLSFGSLPVSPAFLRAQGMRGGKVLLTWPQGLNATAYRIERRDPGSARWRVAGQVPASALRFVETRLRPRERYSFRVIALNASGLASPSPAVTSRPR
jgi:subtilisin-like proprotein convertase family protein